MNYNPYFANPYMAQNPNYGNQYQQAQSNQTSFIGVQNEQEARTYPVAPGNSITFRDESQPYIYTKAMGYSPLDRPTFEKYRLVKEGEANATESSETASKEKEIDLSIYATKDEIKPITEQITAILKDISALKEKTKKKVIREVEVDDE